MILMKKTKSLLLLLPILVLALPGTLLSKTVSLPLTIDYPLLKSLVIQSAFKDPGQTVLLADEAHGCWTITISDPRLAEKKGLVRFQTKIKLHAGIYIFKKCLFPVDWEGYLVLFQVPKIDDKWTLSFDIQDSALYDKHHKPATVASIVWRLVKESVYTYLANITINLAPPVSELKSFVTPLFPDDLRERAVRMVKSMRPGKASATPQAVRIEILTDVEDSYEKKEHRVETITGDELAQLIENWQLWDAYLVYIITTLADEPLSRDDRRILMDVLLETRHRFVSEFISETLSEDLIRNQFISAWENLSPVFRRHLGDDPSKNLLGYLAFFTASDALAALDQIGPQLGVEISRNGLIRLIQMLGEKKEEVLDYQVGVNRKLRSVLGLGPPLPVSGVNPRQEGIETVNSILQMVLSVFYRPPWAADAATEPKRIWQWVLKGGDVDGYVNRVKSLLEAVTDARLADSKLPNTYHPLFRLLVLSTAWQESCFRQFIIKRGKVTYLRSYNGTSVGLMQVNERVWRGIYDQKHLRWDIRYNAMAGCEIIDIYLNKYALKELGGNPPVQDHFLAGAIYAMYNGGPKQLKKYLVRHKKGKYYLSDRLFSEKFIWVKQNRWSNIRICLVGG